MREKIDQFRGEQFGNMEMACSAKDVDKLESDYAELESKIDDVILQENQSLKEQIKILVHITYTYNPDVDINRYLHNLSTEDYLGFLENNKSEEITELENKLEIAIDELNVVAKWKNAYPEDVFPPLTTEQYHGMCKAYGISVDRVSAHVLRKIIIAYSEAAEKVLEKITGES